MTLEIKIVEGYKGPGDKKVQIRASKWTAPSFRNIMEVLDIWFENEDKLYPPPARGREMLLDLIFAVYERKNTQKTLEEIYQEFML